MKKVSIYFILHVFIFSEAFPGNFPPPEILEIAKSLHEICTKRLGVTDDEITNYKIEDKSEKMMCYMRCLGLESKWLTSDNKLQLDYIMESSPASMHEMLNNILQNCKDVPDGSHECEKAYNLNKCATEVEPMRWFLV